MELTILMPCLNEAETLATCVAKARSFLERAGVNGEVLVADNGSTDGSQAIAEGAGARVIAIATRGYGAALAGGIAEARGRYVVMGDADDSYDFSNLDGMLAALRDGNDLVMGNRFRGGIARGAMPPLHRYLGNPVLSFLGRLFYRAPIGDFHCGLRGFSRAAMQDLHLSTTGMEFASEMVVKSTLHKLRIAEVPVTLSRDGRSRPPHLRTWRDGWRHLRFLLLYSPRWLFLLPGLAAMLLGTIAMAAIIAGSVPIGDIRLDIHTLNYASAMVMLGFQMVVFAVLTKFLGIANGWLLATPASTRLSSMFTLERGLIVSALLFIAGLSLSIYALSLWAGTEFGNLGPRQIMRFVIPSVTLMTIAGELFLASFFIEALRHASKRT